MQLIQYNSAALFVGPVDAISSHDTNNINRLYGIQSANYDFAEQLTDIEGEEGSFQRIHAGPNQINLSFNYLVRKGLNEKNIGLVTDGTGTTFANCWSDERNYFVAMKNNHDDLYLYSGYDMTVIAFAQGCISSFGVQGAVGKVLTSNVSLSFLNIGVSLSGNEVQLPIVDKQFGNTIVSYGTDNFYYTGSGTTSNYSTDDSSNNFTGSGTTSDYTGDAISYGFTGSGSTIDYNALDATFTLPFVNPDSEAPIYAIGPGDITINIPNDAVFGSIVSGTDACIIQDFDLSIALPRKEDRPLGYIYPKTRKLDVPIEVRLNINAYVNKQKVAFLNDRLCNNSGQAIEIIVKSSCSGNNGGSGIMIYRLNGARLDSTSANLQIGGMQHISYNWSAKIFNFNQTGQNFGNLTISTPLIN